MATRCVRSRAISAAELLAEFVVGIRRHVVELIDGDQPVVERLDSETVDGEAERGVRADEHASSLFRKLTQAPRPCRRRRFPGRCRGSSEGRPPVGPEAISAERLVWKLAPIDFSGTTTMACRSP
jgi:hypothetical protein